MSVSRPLGIALALTSAFLSLAVPAHADTDLVGSAPLTGPDGARVDDGEPLVADTRVQQPIETTANGEYAVVFRVVAEDGHPVKGTVTFTLDAPAEPGFWATNGAQVIGIGAVLLLTVVVAALRLRPRPAIEHGG